MLMQLVCVDRRYQRMNCFNIRELQGVLKRKFFTDLVNTNDHRDFLNQSMIGLRFKTNNQLSIIPDVESFFNLGTTNNTKSKTLNFTNSYESLTSYFSTTFLSYNTSQFFTLHFFINSLKSLLINLTSLLISFNPQSLITCTYSFNAIISLVKTNLTFEILVTSNNMRFTRFNNPLISYDYKCGHYLGI
jgi:hypothetical protein